MNPGKPISGVPGVVWDKRESRWRVVHRARTLGYFADLGAAKARKAKALREDPLAGEFKPVDGPRSGVPGVTWKPNRNCWVATHKDKHLGSFRDLDAAKAAKAAAQETDPIEENYEAAVVKRRGQVLAGVSDETERLSRAIGAIEDDAAALLLADLVGRAVAVDIAMRACNATDRAASRAEAFEEWAVPGGRDTLRTAFERGMNISQANSKGDDR